MRLAFLCGSLEPGRDGVGDYSRRLAGECIRQGHLSVMVGINDPYLQKAQCGSQEIEGASISVLRLPAVMPWSERLVEARTWLGEFQPDWTSLQFVPFAFHRKGLCFGLGKFLASASPNSPWHIMFHELWLGLGENAPLKDRVYGAMQRRIALDLAGRLQPRIVNTQAEPYRRALQRENIRAAILPLFSNVPKVAGDGWGGLLEPLVTEAVGDGHDRNHLYLAGVLGGVHPEWDAEEAVNTILPLARRWKKRLILVFIGKNNLAQKALNQLKSQLQNRAQVVVTGERTGAEISRILQSLDLGLAASPRQMIQKSGSAAAMLEHGLKMLVTRDDWRLREANPPAETNPPWLLSPGEFAALEILPIRDVRPPEGENASHVAGRMLAAMNAAVPLREEATSCAF